MELSLIDKLKPFSICSHVKSFTFDNGCPACAVRLAVDNLEKYISYYRDAQDKVAEEKNTRIQYQNLVYSLCSLFDEVGTVEEGVVGKKCQINELEAHVKALKVRASSVPPVIFDPVMNKSVSLRMLLTGHALQGILANNDLLGVLAGKPEYASKGDQIMVAEYALRFADAVIIEGAK